MVIAISMCGAAVDAVSTGMRTVTSNPMIQIYTRFQTPTRFGERWEPFEGKLTGKIREFSDMNAPPELEIAEIHQERYGFLWLRHRSVETTRWIERCRLRHVYERIVPDPEKFIHPPI
jgi:hypothetical protein